MKEEKAFILLLVRASSIYQVFPVLWKYLIYSCESVWSKIRGTRQNEVSIFPRYMAAWIHLKRKILVRLLFQLHSSSLKRMLCQYWTWNTVKILDLEANRSARSLGQLICDLSQEKTFALKQVQQPLNYRVLYKMHTYMFPPRLES